MRLAFQQTITPPGGCLGVTTYLPSPQCQHRHTTAPWGLQSSPQGTPTPFQWRRRSSSRSLFARSGESGGDGETLKDTLGRLGQVCKAIQRLGMGLVATGATFWCPSPDMLAPFGLQDVIVTSSQAAALSDEKQLIADVWKRVDKVYLDRTFNGQDWFALRQAALKKPIKTQQDVYDAIKEMLAPLGDPYTRFLTPSQFESLYGLATGSVAGIGVSLATDPASQELQVLEVEKGSPAEEAGVQRKDIIAIIDGSATKDLLIDDSATLLRGPAGSKVGIVVRRAGATTPLDFILTRREIKIQSVEASTDSKRGKKLGIIRIRNFSQTTSDTVKEKLQEFEKAGCQAFVIDLRGNPGGYLGGGIDTAKLFLPAVEKITSVVGRTGIVEEYQTTDDGIEISKPLFVLVDERTASASEVLSAALKENGRAKIVGKKTFGKGVIQTVELVSQGAGVTVTIAAYNTPLGNNINKKGIEVDIPSDCEATDTAAACLPDSVL